MSQPVPEPVKVAVGILIIDGKVLCCQRKKNMRYGLQWEFPGGKVKPGESPRDCLIRELQEEISIAVTAIEPYAKHIQSYSDNGVFAVHYFLITDFQGEVKNNAFESIRWSSPGEFDALPFLAGNKPVLDRLKEEFTGS